MMSSVTFQTALKILRSSKFTSKSEFEELFVSYLIVIPIYIHLQAFSFVDFGRPNHNNTSLQDTMRKEKGTDFLTDIIYRNWSVYV